MASTAHCTRCCVQILHYYLALYKLKTVRPYLDRLEFVYCGLKDLYAYDVKASFNHIYFRL
jgi:hypothetical protein